MSAYHGPQERQPMHARGRNKGVRAWLRSVRREQAAERNARTAPDRRRRKRAAS
jgi:hypothetical protein